MKHILSRWVCTNCKKHFMYTDQHPEQSLKACVWYGSKGIPPWDKIYNDKPLNATFNYCGDCCGTVKQ